MSFSTNVPLCTSAAVCTLQSDYFERSGRGDKLPLTEQTLQGQITWACAVDPAWSFGRPVRLRKGKKTPAKSPFLSKDTTREQTEPRLGIVFPSGIRLVHVHDAQEALDAETRAQRLQVSSLSTRAGAGSRGAAEAPSVEAASAPVGVQAAPSARCTTIAREPVCVRYVPLEAHVPSRADGGSKGSGRPAWVPASTIHSFTQASSEPSPHEGGEGPGQRGGGVGEAWLPAPGPDSLPSFPPSAAGLGSLQQAASSHHSQRALTGHVLTRWHAITDEEKVRVLSLQLSVYAMQLSAARFATVGDTGSNGSSGSSGGSSGSGEGLPGVSPAGASLLDPEVDLESAMRALMARARVACYPTAICITVPQWHTRTHAAYDSLRVLLVSFETHVDPGCPLGPRHAMLLMAALNGYVPLPPPISTSASCAGEPTVVDGSWSAAPVSGLLVTAPAHASGGSSATGHSPASSSAHAQVAAHTPSSPEASSRQEDVGLFCGPREVLTMMRSLHAPVSASGSAPASPLCASDLSVSACTEAQTLGLLQPFPSVVASAAAATASAGEAVALTGGEVGLRAPSGALALVLPWCDAQCRHGREGHEGFATGRENQGQARACDACAATAGVSSTSTCSHTLTAQAYGHSPVIFLPPTHPLSWELPRLPWFCPGCGEKFPGVASSVQAQAAARAAVRSGASLHSSSRCIESGGTCVACTSRDCLRAAGLPALGLWAEARIRAQREAQAWGGSRIRVPQGKRGLAPALPSSEGAVESMMSTWPRSAHTHLESMSSSTISSSGVSAAAGTQAYLPVPMLPLELCLPGQYLSALPWIDADPRPLLSRVQPRHLLGLLTSLLAERNVLLVTRDTRLLPEVWATLTSLLHPFTLACPAFPLKHADYPVHLAFESPFPTVAGCHPDAAAAADMPTSVWEAGGAPVPDVAYDTGDAGADGAAAGMLTGGAAAADGRRVEYVRAEGEAATRMQGLPELLLPPHHTSSSPGGSLYGHRLRAFHPGPNYWIRAYGHLLGPTAAAALSTLALVVGTEGHGERAGGKHPLLYTDPDNGGLPFGCLDSLSRAAAALLPFLVDGAGQAGQATGAGGGEAWKRRDRSVDDDSSASEASDEEHHHMIGTGTGGCGSPSSPPFLPLPLQLARTRQALAAGTHHVLHSGNRGIKASTLALLRHVGVLPPLPGSTGPGAVGQAQSQGQGQETGSGTGTDTATVAGEGQQGAQEKERMQAQGSLPRGGSGSSSAGYVLSSTWRAVETGTRATVAATVGLTILTVAATAAVTVATARVTGKALEAAVEYTVGFGIPLPAAPDTGPVDALGRPLGGGAGGRGVRAGGLRASIEDGEMPSTGNAAAALGQTVVVDEVDEEEEEEEADGEGEDGADGPTRGQGEAAEGGGNGTASPADADAAALAAGAAASIKRVRSRRRARRSKTELAMRSRKRLMASALNGGSAGGGLGGSGSGQGGGGGGGGGAGTDSHVIVDLDNDLLSPTFMPRTHLLPARVTTRLWLALLRFAPLWSWARHGALNPPPLPHFGPGCALADVEAAHTIWMRMRARAEQRGWDAAVGPTDASLPRMRFARALWRVRAGAHMPVRVFQADSLFRATAPASGSCSLVDLEAAVPPPSTSWRGGSGLGGKGTAAASPASSAGLAGGMETGSSAAAAVAPGSSKAGSFLASWVSPSPSKRRAAAATAPASSPASSSTATAGDGLMALGDWRVSTARQRDGSSYRGGMGGVAHGRRPSSKRASLSSSPSPSLSGGFDTVTSPTSASASSSSPPSSSRSLSLPASSHPLGAAQHQQQSSFRTLEAVNEGDEGEEEEQEALEEEEAREAAALRSAARAGGATIPLQPLPASSSSSTHPPPLLSNPNPSSLSQRQTSFLALPLTFMRPGSVLASAGQQGRKAGQANDGAEEGEEEQVGKEKGLGRAAAAGGRQRVRKRDMAALVREGLLSGYAAAHASSTSSSSSSAGRGEGGDERERKGEGTDPAAAADGSRGLDPLDTAPVPLYGPWAHWARMCGELQPESDPVLWVAARAAVGGGGPGHGPGPGRGEAGMYEVSRKERERIAALRESGDVLGAATAEQRAAAVLAAAAGGLPLPALLPQPRVHWTRLRRAFLGAWAGLLKAWRLYTVAVPREGSGLCQAFTAQALAAAVEYAAAASAAAAGAAGQGQAGQGGGAAAQTQGAAGTHPSTPAPPPGVYRRSSVASSLDVSVDSLHVAIDSSVDSGTAGGAGVVPPGSQPGSHVHPAAPDLPSLGPLLAAVLAGEDADPMLDSVAFLGQELRAAVVGSGDVGRGLGMGGVGAVGASDASSAGTAVEATPHAATDGTAGTSPSPSSPVPAPAVAVASSTSSSSSSAAAAAAAAAAALALAVPAALASAPASTAVLGGGTYAYLWPRLPGIDHAEPLLSHILQGPAQWWSLYVDQRGLSRRTALLQGLLLRAVQLGGGEGMAPVAVSAVPRPLVDAFDRECISRLQLRALRMRALRAAPYTGDMHKAMAGTLCKSWKLRRFELARGGIVTYYKEGAAIEAAELAVSKLRTKLSALLASVEASAASRSRASSSAAGAAVAVVEGGRGRSGTDGLAAAVYGSGVSSRDVLVMAMDAAVAAVRLELVKSEEQLASVRAAGFRGVFYLVPGRTVLRIPTLAPSAHATGSSGAGAGAGGGEAAAVSTGTGVLTGLLGSRGGARVAPRDKAAPSSTSVAATLLPTTTPSGPAVGGTTSTAAAAAAGGAAADTASAANTPSTLQALATVSGQAVGSAALNVASKASAGAASLAAGALGAAATGLGAAFDAAASAVGVGAASSSELADVYAGLPRQSSFPTPYVFQLVNPALPGFGPGHAEAEARQGEGRGGNAASVEGSGAVGAPSAPRTGTGGLDASALKARLTGSDKGERTLDFAGPQLQLLTLCAPSSEARREWIARMRAHVRAGVGGLAGHAFLPGASSSFFTPPPAGTLLAALEPEEAVAVRVLSRALGLPLVNVPLPRPQGQAPRTPASPAGLEQSVEMAVLQMLYLGQLPELSRAALVCLGLGLGMGSNVGAAGGAGEAGSQQQQVTLSPVLSPLSLPAPGSGSSAVPPLPAPRGGGEGVPGGPRRLVLLPTTATAAPAPAGTMTEAGGSTLFLAQWQPVASPLSPHLSSSHTHTHKGHTQALAPAPASAPMSPSFPLPPSAHVHPAPAGPAPLLALVASSVEGEGDAGEEGEEGVAVGLSDLTLTLSHPTATATAAQGPARDGAEQAPVVVIVAAPAAEAEEAGRGEGEGDGPGIERHLSAELVVGPEVQVQLTEAAPPAHTGTELELKEQQGSPRPLSPIPPRPPSPSPAPAGPDTDVGVPAELDPRRETELIQARLALIEQQYAAGLASIAQEYAAHLPTSVAEDRDRLEAWREGETGRITGLYGDQKAALQEYLTAAASRAALPLPHQEAHVQAESEAEERVPAQPEMEVSLSSTPTPAPLPVPVPVPIPLPVTPEGAEQAVEAGDVEQLEGEQEEEEAVETLPPSPPEPQQAEQAPESGDSASGDSASDTRREGGGGAAYLLPLEIAVALAASQSGGQPGEAAAAGGGGEDAAGSSLVDDLLAEWAEAPPDVVRPLGLPTPAPQPEGEGESRPPSPSGSLSAQLEEAAAGGTEGAAGKVEEEEEEGGVRLMPLTGVAGVPGLLWASQQQR